jgi:hypothetical protein
MYRSLDPEKIVATVEKLHMRIAERFPDSGLSGVCAELLKVARESQKRAAWIAKPQRTLRAAIGVLVALIVAGLAAILSYVRLPSGGFDAAGFIQVSEAGVNLLIVLGATILFLFTVETRIKRSRAIKAIHELRALAHVIDMHQLTKDPERVSGGGRQTPSSPRQNLTPFELTRYLDYCSEMLSVTGKIAALYVQKFDDPVVLAAAEDVEALTTGLSRKIWQKIMILNPALPKAGDGAAKETSPRARPGGRKSTQRV